LIPSHKDFAEDTFRTLTAVDSVIVVIDVAKGGRTNRETGRYVDYVKFYYRLLIKWTVKENAFDLMDEVEQKLDYGYPLSFPIGMGYDFQGIYNLWEQNINLFSGNM
jgi:peptide chain release factor 3